MALFRGADGLVVGPVLDFFHGQEASLHPVHDVVERIGRVVRPVHDLALDALELVERLTLAQRARNGGTVEHEIAVNPLRVVKEVVLRRTGPLAEEQLVFQDAVEQCPGGPHPAHAGLVLEDRLGEQVQRLRIALKTSPFHHEFLQGAFARMPERRMTEIVREADRLHEVAVDVEIGFQRPAACPQEMADGTSDL